RLDRLAAVEVVECVSNTLKRIRGDQLIDREAALPPILEHHRYRDLRIRVATQNPAQTDTARHEAEQRRTPRLTRRGYIAQLTSHREHLRGRVEYFRDTGCDQAIINA